ncbi:conserved hypothetical protein,predicted acyltransferase 3 family family [Aromatoleum aromaticum EbN1]|uniref:Acyltransferase 3 domain-containing protein n=1 Tax=Aromatoleum aromaticum (strain DSM 19018 / LMG 30748 / EbN1) TaxID=76114 RepID=Q5P6S7_AROAE|nr:acyltransferase family protein [Aromatoleum aromaticum]CAI06984.1 conserved hypothetical protein,predicted acyltransferase 3 family family [Aromatoleum aromaticum EbN1]
MKAESHYGLDVIRAVASFLVVVLHVAAGGFYRFDDNWFAINLYDSFVRVAVPLFLMVTGVLLLNREQPLASFLFRRARRVLPALLFWSAVYAYFQGYSVTDLAGFVRRLATGPVQYHLWYLYALFGIYAFVPVMRAVHLHASVAENRFFLLMWAFVSCIWPVVATHFNFSYDLIDVYWLHSFLGMAVYLLVGAHLGYLLRRSNRLPGFALFALSAAAVAAATHYRALQAGAPDELFYAYLSPFVLLGSIGAFLFLGAAQRADSWISPAVRMLSAHSLGIYCVHVLFIDFTRETLGLSLSSGSAWWTVPVISVLVFALAAATAWVIGRLPLLRRVV